ncbi:MAG: elongation factor 1-beta [Candidatus Lokiarchaeota archaeon]|nr:elongation factor 1-beta [Candidatus Lokiarchaeota archaeon]
MGKKAATTAQAGSAPGSEAPGAATPAKKKEKAEGTNVALIRVLPEDVDIDLINLKDQITNVLLTDVKDLEGNHKVCQLLVCKEEPIAFGLKALNLQVSMPEFMAGGTQPVEDVLSKLPGVQRVEVGIVTRL